jgi:hypothetical protein
VVKKKLFRKKFHQKHFMLFRKKNIKKYKKKVRKFFLVEIYEQTLYDDNFWVLRNDPEYLFLKFK